MQNLVQYRVVANFLDGRIKNRKKSEKLLYISDKVVV